MIVPGIKVENSDNKFVNQPYVWIDGELYKVKTLNIQYNGGSNVDSITINIVAEE